MLPVQSVNVHGLHRFSSSPFKYLVSCVISHVVTHIQMLSRYLISLLMVCLTMMGVLIVDSDTVSHCCFDNAYRLATGKDVQHICECVHKAAAAAGAGARCPEGLGLALWHARHPLHDPGQSVAIH